MDGKAPPPRRTVTRHALLLTGVVILSFLASGTPLIQRFEAITFDMRLASRPPRPVPEEIVFFDIDDEALKQIGRWPWPRSRLGEVVSAISRAGARGVFLDIEFPEKSRLTVPEAAGFRSTTEAIRKPLAEHVQGLESFAAQMTSTGPVKDLSRQVRRLATHLDYRIRSAVDSLEAAVEDPDRELARALAASGSAHGVCYLVIPASEEERHVTRVRETLVDWLRENQEATQETLPKEFRDYPRAEEILQHARLRNLLARKIDISTDEAAQELHVDRRQVDQRIESARVREMRRIVRNVIAREPGATAAEQVAAALAILQPADPQRLKSQLDALAEVEAVAHYVLQRWGLQPRDGPVKLELPRAPSFFPPIGSLARQFASVSCSNAFADEDGVLRRVSLLWQVEDRFLRSAGLTLAMAHVGADPSTLEIVAGPALQFRSSQEKIYRVPVDREGRILVDWAGQWGTYPHFSLAGVWDLVQLEKAYEARLRKLDKTGLAEQLGRLRARARAGELRISVASRGSGEATTSIEIPIADRIDTLESQILAAAQEGLDYQLSKIEAAGEPSSDRDRKRLARRQEYYQRNLAIMQDAGSLKQNLRDRQRQLDEMARGRLCFVGATASGTVDLTVMPYQEAYPRVGLHANVAGSILAGRYLYRATDLENLALIAGSALITGSLFTLSSLQAGLLLGLALIATYWVLSMLILTGTGTWIPVIAPTLAIVLTGSSLLVGRYFTEVRKKRELENMFGYYLSPEVIQQLKADPTMLKRGGVEAEITSFFTDLAGFSSVAEHIPPAEVVALINDYLGQCTEILQKYHGTLERYECDAIRAMFGSPVNVSDHAERACRTALEMHAVVQRMRAEARALGRPDFAMRLGLNTGMALIGNIGAKNRFTFTMMGDSVNLAARLEAINKQYGTSIMVGEATRKMAGDAIEVRELDQVRVAGRQTPVRIYELQGMAGEASESQKQVAAHYGKGLAAYRLGNWAEGIEHFEGANAVGEGDPPSVIMANRCRDNASNPPADWDGVVSLQK